jgi:Protein of unknwon function (DUF3310)
MERDPNDICANPQCFHARRFHSDLGCQGCDCGYTAFSNTFSSMTDAEVAQALGHDPVNHPRHYTSHKSGVECITITEHMSFLIGNAVKYLWRADEKGSPIEDLEKARWYIDREIANRKAKL